MTGKPWTGCLQSTQPDPADGDAPAQGWKRRLDGRVHDQPVAFRMVAMPSCAEDGVQMHGGRTSLASEVNEPRMPDNALVRDEFTGRMSEEGGSQETEGHRSLPAYEECMDGPPPLYHLRRSCTLTHHVPDRKSIRLFVSARDPRCGKMGGGHAEKPGAMVPYPVALGKLFQEWYEELEILFDQQVDLSLSDRQAGLLRCLRVHMFHGCF